MNGKSAFLVALLVVGMILSACVPITPAQQPAPQPTTAPAQSPAPQPTVAPTPQPTVTAAPQPTTVPTQPPPTEAVPEPPRPTPVLRGDITLGLVLSTLSDPFCVALQEGAQKEVTAQSYKQFLMDDQVQIVPAEVGVVLIVVDAQNDPATQAAAIEDLINKQVNALLINPTDAGDNGSVVIAPSIQKANAANIPVFTVDRSASGGFVVSHIASDNVAGGKMAAGFLCEAIGGKGNIGLSVVVELQGTAGTSAARDRGQGFNDELKAACPGAVIVAQQTADFDRAKGLSVFENILQSQPDIAGVFAHNDEMVLGAIQAAEAAKRTGIVFVGFDGIDDAVQAVEEGKLAATVAQQPAEIGKLAVQTAVTYLKGEEVEKSIGVPLSLVTHPGR